MTMTRAFSSTVGGSAQIVSTFAIKSVTAYGLNIPALSYHSDSSRVDASNTAYLLIDVLTPGAGFSSDSGATYVLAAVPEPGSSALLFSAAMLMGIGIACGKSQRRLEH